MIPNNVLLGLQKEVQDMSVGDNTPNDVAKHVAKELLPYIDQKQGDLFGQCVRLVRRYCLQLGCHETTTRSELIKLVRDKYDIS